MNRPRDRIAVVAGILVDSGQRVLLAERPATSSHGAGFWEFPGGKIESGEPPLAALRRELYEELAIAVDTAVPFIALDHDYPERAVSLQFFLIDRWRGEPRACDGQRLAWVGFGDLAATRLLPADGPVVNELIERFGRG